MTVRTSFAEFLKTGRIGPIVEKKTTRAELFRMCGKPQSAWNGDFGSLVWYYGAIEIGFFEQSPNAVVAYIQIENVDKQGFTIGYRGLQIDSGTHNSMFDRFDSLRRFAHRNGVRTVPVVRRSLRDTGLITEGSVVILRDDEEPQCIVHIGRDDFPYWGYERIPAGFVRPRLQLWQNPGRRIVDRLAWEAREATRAPS